MADTAQSPNQLRQDRLCTFISKIIPQVWFLMISSWEYTTEHIAAKTFFPVTSSNVSDSPFFIVYWILWEIVGLELRYWLKNKRTVRKEVWFLLGSSTWRIIFKMLKNITPDWSRACLEKGFCAVVCWRGEMMPELQKNPQAVTMKLLESHRAISCTVF